MHKTYTVTMLTICQWITYTSATIVVGLYIMGVWV